LAAKALLLGFGGVLGFSFTFPATKLALHSFGPWFIAFGRAGVAAGLAAVTLRRQRASRPTGAQWLRLAVVAGGCVVGFPALSSVALQSSSSSHSAVVIAVLPAATAIAGALRGRESTSLVFWLGAAAGTATVTLYVAAHAGGAVAPADLYLLVGVVVCALGYAEGGLLARSLGGPQTNCWALVLALPVTLPVALLTAPARAPSASALAGLMYLSVVSMFLAFFCWYAGLARGGVARVSQLQLAQTPLTLAWSALLLGERIGAGTLGVAALVLVSVAVTQRARVRRRPGMSSWRDAELKHRGEHPGWRRRRLPDAAR
jgi:drug/metabolite transporter (DMT)-like permease